MQSVLRRHKSAGAKKGYERKSAGNIEKTPISDDVDCFDTVVITAVA